MPKLKIFVSYKFKKPILRNEIVEPIQTGRAIADEVFDGMIGDDTGQNISDKNPRYNELTAQYWVWKNYEAVGNPDYIGFMHYRRQFIFDKALNHLPIVWLPDTKFYFVKEIYPDYMKHFSSDKVFPYLEDKPDCIAYKHIDIKPVSKQTNMRNHFYMGMPWQKVEVFDIFEQVIREFFPRYVQTFEKFKNGTTMFCCNSFVMPKDVFFEYSEFLFGVLEKVDERVDSAGFNTGELRFLGFLGEYLLSIFIMHKLQSPDFKLKELDGTFVNTGYKKIRRRLLKGWIFSRIFFGRWRTHYLRKYVEYRHYYSN